MSDDMIQIFKKLNTNEKRDKLNELLIKIDQLLNELMIEKNINISNFKPAKNYNSANQKLQSEDEVLLFIYDDLWNLKSKLLALLTKN